MIKVLKHGDIIGVTNPVTGQETQMQNIVFVEEGREGADSKMSGSSDLLSELTGQNVGLEQIRVHTHPVLLDKVGLFPVDKTFPGHINRGMYSTPQLRQQVDKDPRIIDGRPTYFKTWLGSKPEPDADYRMSLDTLAQVRPNEFVENQLGATQVRTIQKADVGSSGSGGSTVPQGEVGAGVTETSQVATNR